MVGSKPALREPCCRPVRCLRIVNMLGLSDGMLRAVFLFSVLRLSLDARMFKEAIPDQSAESRPNRSSVVFSVRLTALVAKSMPPLLIGGIKSVGQGEFTAM